MKIKKEITANVKLSREELSMCIELAAIVVKSCAEQCIRDRPQITINEDSIEKFSAIASKIYSLHHLLDECYSKLNVSIQDK